MTADLIEGYLDRLLTYLRGSAHDVRRILSEAEEHLRDATAELRAAGLDEEEAQRRAIERFGDARTVARRPARHDLHRATVRRVPGVLPRRR